MRLEPILLRAKRYNFFPHRFVHRGVEQRVRRVEQIWEIGPGWRRRTGRVYRVTCQDNGRYDVFHDVAINAWFIRHSGVGLLGMMFGKAVDKGKLRWTFT